MGPNDRDMSNSSVQDSAQTENNSVSPENFYANDLPPTSPNPTELPPETTQPSADNRKSLKPLIIIFSCLSLAIVSLVITIIIVKNNQSSEPGQHSASNQLADQKIINPEGLKMGEEFQVKLSDTVSKATELLEQDINNTDAVIELYSKVISEYQGPEMTGYVQSLINSEVDLLLSYGFTEKAFEVYSLIDTYIPTDEIIQNELYSKALALAKSENQENWINLFQAKCDATNAAKEAEIQAIIDAKANYDAYIEQLVKEDDQTEEE